MRPQRPLWASTGTKDPAYSDVLYVERLIAPGVVNTMPEDAAPLREHGNVGHALDANLDEVERLWRRLGDRPRSARLTSELEREGVEAFCASYDELLDCIGSKLDPLAGVERASGGTPDPPVALTAG